MRIANRRILGKNKSQIQYYFTVSQQVDGLKDGWMVNPLPTTSLPGEFFPPKAMIQIHQHLAKLF